MKTGVNKLRDLYFTTDHEWIDFMGPVAYTGISAFKLSGFKAVEEIQFHELSGFIRKGDIIATIHYKDYQIAAHMPVDGKILQLNEVLLSGDRNILLSEPENNGWIALLAPVQPYERKELLLPIEYRAKLPKVYSTSKQHV